MPSETCCMTHCDTPQGGGTWVDVNGATLPVCEAHWYGNLVPRAEVERLTAERDEAVAALDVLYAYRSRTTPRHVLDRVLAALAAARTYLGGEATE